MNFNFKRNRAIKIIKKALIDLQLDLCGKVILTELGSNDFLFTPLIPILANANKVYAFVKDSKYGKAEDLKKEFELHFADFEGIEKIQIFCNNLPNFCIKEADIITNSAHLRPLNASKLSLAQKNVVIPIMYEAWELRDGEIDLDFCRKNSIPLGGTNESYELTNVFNYVKVLGLKLALNAGYEIIENEIFIWSNDSFGEMLNQSFTQNGANVHLSTEIDLFYSQLPKLDILFVADYFEERDYFGVDNSIFDVDKIMRINPNLCIIHLYGKVNNDLLNKFGFHVFPNKKGLYKVMTETLSYSGQLPILKLLVAGFKVAEELISKKYSKITQIINE